MKRDVRDPQVELVRRYARILRSAPAEAVRAWEAPPLRRSRFARAGTNRSTPEQQPASRSEKAARLA
jgi:hypothetical protein